MKVVYARIFPNRWVTSGVAVAKCRARFSETKTRVRYRPHHTRSNQASGLSARAKARCVPVSAPDFDLLVSHQKKRILGLNFLKLNLPK